MDITSQTIYDQIDTIAWYLKPKVFKGILEEISNSYITIADETTWGKLDKPQKGDPKKFYLWAVMNHRAICFNVFDRRNQKNAKNDLGHLKGVLVSDGLGIYKALASKDLILANDWYHLRRKFYLSEKSYPEEPKYFIRAIKELSHFLVTLVKSIPHQDSTT